MICERTMNLVYAQRSSVNWASIKQWIKYRYKLIFMLIKINYIWIKIKHKKQDIKWVWEIKGNNKSRN
jgi:hypothetical protein